MKTITDYYDNLVPNQNQAAVSRKVWASYSAAQRRKRGFAISQGRRRKSRKDTSKTDIKAT